MLDNGVNSGNTQDKQDNKNFYPNVRINRTKPHLGYISVAKSGCTSVGQIMHFVDTGMFLEGNIHHEPSSIMKWDNERDRDEMMRVLSAERPYWFSLVRNPYTRLLSAFSDKIFGYQENGKRYRAGKVQKHLQMMGLTWGPGSNLIKNFRFFLKFVESNIEHEKPFAADIHWAPQYEILKANAKLNPGFKFDYVGHVESFRPDMEEILRRAGIDLQKIPTNIPRENSTSISKIPVSEFYGPKEMGIMLRIYEDDFNYFGYAKDPCDYKPLESIDLEYFNRSLHRNFASEAKDEI